MARALAGEDLVPAVAQATVVAPDAVGGGEASTFFLLAQRRLGIFLVQKPLLFELGTSGLSRFGIEVLQRGHWHLHDTAALGGERPLTLV